MTTNVATGYVLARLAELEQVQAAGETISGQLARGLVLPPHDEDPDIEGRITLYRRWLARHAEPAEVRQEWQQKVAEEQKR